MSRQPLTSSRSDKHGQKIVGGKRKLPAKTRLERERADYSRTCIWQLHAALIESTKELQDLWQRGAISEELADLIRSIFITAFSTLEDSLKHDGRGAPKTLSNSKRLMHASQIFRIKINQLLTHDQPHALALAWCLYEFCCDIAHYEQQIKYAYGFVLISAEGRPKLANRPTKWKAKAEFDKFIIQHQNVHGHGLFPKINQIKTHLIVANQSVAERTVREWIRQIKSGKFGNHIQPKKRQ
jgi:hypothetical protein